jgi:hypothetical protein
VSTSSFSRSPRGSSPQCLGASSSGTTISSPRPLSPPLAFGDELIDLELPNESDDESDDESDSQWLSQGGRESAAAHLLPRAEAALRQELQRLADAVKRAREGQSLSSSGSRAQ